MLGLSCMILRQSMLVMNDNEGFELRCTRFIFLLCDRKLNGKEMLIISYCGRVVSVVRRVLSAFSLLSH